MRSIENDTAPADYRLLLPEGWCRILLDSDVRNRSVEALVERQFNGIDNAPHLKEALSADLRRAAKAYRSGGIELYLSLQEAGPFTVPASLLVTLAPLRHAEPLPPEDLARALAAEAEPGETPEVSVEELAAGAAVRVRRRTKQPSPDSGGAKRRARIRLRGIPREACRGGQPYA